MRVLCTVCATDDIPETTDLGLDATARDHLRVWHPGEWMTADVVDGVCVLSVAAPVASDARQAAEPRNARLNALAGCLSECWGDQHIPLSVRYAAAKLADDLVAAHFDGRSS